eukprot:gene4919-5399_t
MKNIRNYFSTTTTDQPSSTNKKVKLTHEKTEEVEHSSSSLITGSDTTTVTTTPTEPAVVGDSTSTTASTADNSEDLPLVNWPPMDTLEKSWRQRLLSEYSKSYFSRLLAFLSSETATAGKVIYPPSDQIFTALNLCPYDQVKVVIIGQDPYHGPGQAHGLAFSVKKGVPAPPSLKNIFSELQADPAIHITKPSHGNLEKWSHQGVLLLNTVLTVRKAEANSHQKKGWEEFTDAIVRELAKKQGLVYLLWGKPAQNKCAGIDHRANVVLTSSHPSPLAAYKTNEPFMGSRIFSRCNEALVRQGKEPIDWNVD